jgi:transposase-like protein
MTADRRHYSAETRSEAVGLALSVGVKEAGRRLGIPYRTVSHWLARPEAQVAITRSRDDVAAKLWEAVTVGTEAVLAGLRDPKARLSDKAQALRVVAEQYALLTGGATSRSENLNINADAELAPPQLSWEEMAQLAEWLDASLAAGVDPAAIDEAMRTTRVADLPQLENGQDV